MIPAAPHTRVTKFSTALRDDLDGGADPHRRTHQIRVHFQFIGHPSWRRYLRRATKRPRQGTDQLRRPARDAARETPVLHPSAHAEADEF